MSSAIVVVKDPEEARAACDAARAQGHVVGLVPTMGALHAGHLSLVREAQKHATFVVCSIFVNPTQFGPTEDLAQYPRDLAGDVRQIEGEGASLVLAPSVSAMYLPGDETRVNVGSLAAHLCGPLRPGHFEGVATVVTKLFALAGPCTAVFGKKDYQQLAILRRVAADLFLPVRIVAHPIVREADGLAMSSRNAYLSAAERLRALSLSRGLSRAAHLFASGERRAGALRVSAATEVESGASSVEYVTVAAPESLVPFGDSERVGGRALLALACRIGATRLIDNIVLGEDGPPA